MNNAKLQESWKAAIVHHVHGEEFIDLRNSFHNQAIGLMSYMTRMMMDHSLHRVFTCEECVVWVVAINFIPGKTDIENFKKYALCIYALTGITRVRVAHMYNNESCNLRVNPGGSITSNMSKLGE